MTSTEILGVKILNIKFQNVIGAIVDLAAARMSSYICVANVHMIMESYWDDAFRKILNSSDAVIPDGMPLVWFLKAFGAENAERMAGLDVLDALSKAARDRRIGIFLLGSTPEVLVQIQQRMQSDYPGIIISGVDSPPFRALTDDEDLCLIDKINDTGAGLLFVALGCPKQERWMSNHKDQIHCAMVGLGGAFPVYAGELRRAPRWVRNAGFEWLYRLLQEPNRLWKRYWQTNIPFLLLATKQLIHQKANRIKKY